jgi:hypothetical protein
MFNIIVNSTNLGNIGLEDNSSLRTSLTEGLKKLDNVRDK